MSNQNVRSVSNNFQDVQLASLASWKQAGEFVPRDRGGPYVILQAAYDPEDPTMTADEFVLGRSGKWLSLAYFYLMPIPERRAEYVFGTAAEVMEMMSRLPPKAAVVRPGKKGEVAPPPATDEMAAALEAGRKARSGTAG